jgi:hypothetical protein
MFAVLRICLFFIGTVLLVCTFERPAAAQGFDIIDDEFEDVTFDFCDPSIGDDCTVESVASFVASTDSAELDTYNATFITFDLIDYDYGAEADVFLDQDGSEIASGAAFDDGSGTAELDGFFGLTVNSIYDLFTDSYLDDFLYGGSYYILSSGVEMSSGLPQINSISPTSGYVGTSGTISIQGQNLIDPFTGWVTVNTSGPNGGGQGFSVYVQNAASDGTQVTLGYTIAQNATTGPWSLSLQTRFGIGTTSSNLAFQVIDATPVVNSVNPNVWMAGTTTQITIGGLHFGTNPSLTITGPGVSGYSISSANDTTIQASVSVDPNSPGGTATVQVQSHGYTGSGFLGNPSQPSTGSNTATIDPLQAPVPQIVLEPDTAHQGNCSSGTNIAGKTTTVFGGQQLVLTACVPNLPANVSINPQSQTWSVQNQADLTGGYCAPNAYNTCGTAGQELADPQMTGVNGMTFYWVNPGTTEAVTFSYQLNNGTPPATATANFTINGPTGATVSNDPNYGGFSAVAVYLGTDPITNQQGYDLGLGYGTNYPPNNATTHVGIALDIGPLNNQSLVTNWTDGANGTGSNSTFTWVQLLTNDKLRFRNSSINPACSGGQTCTCYPPGGLPTTAELDGAYPYINSDSRANHVFTDSPRTPLVDTEVEQVFAATTYLMWDPALPTGCQPANSQAAVSTPSTCSQSIPIPLGSINWNWGGNALDTGVLQATPNNTTYKLCCGPEHEDPSFTPGSAYPQWQAVAPSPLPPAQMSCSQP